MDYELPTEFDIVIVGTGGIVESIVSAAASRIGKTVLHIDSKDYYGGLWASFNLEQIDKLFGNNQDIKTDFSHDVKLNEGETLFPTGNNFFDLKNTSQKWNIPEKVECKIESEQDKIDDQDKNDRKEVDNGAVKDEIWTQEKLLKESRRFNIDIAPKLQFARGDFVELSISSNIARYSEYRSVSRVLTWLNGQLEVVPCSRSDVFSNTKVSVIEKRILMKLLAICMDSEEIEFKDYENKTFRTYLKDKKLTDNVIHYVLYAIAMCTDDTPCLEGVENIILTKWHTKPTASGRYINFFSHQSMSIKKVLL